MGVQHFSSRTPSQASWCRMDESHLTGESDSVQKDAQIAPQALSGSKVLEGSGKLLVTAVGSESQQGIILASLTEGDKSDDGLKYARVCLLHCGLCSGYGSAWHVSCWLSSI